MVDVARVVAKLAALEGYLDRLRELAALDAARYVAERRYEGRYLVQAGAQTVIDLANHLIASEGWAPATSYRDAFSRLGQHGVLAPDLVERLQSLAGLRNRLVHLYDDMDDALVHAALRAGVDDLSAFAQAVAARAGR